MSASARSGDPFLPAGNEWSVLLHLVRLCVVDQGEVPAHFDPEEVLFDRLSRIHMLELSLRDSGPEHWRLTIPEGVRRSRFFRREILRLQRRIGFSDEAFGVLVARAMRLASSVVESMRDSRTQLSIGDFQVHAMLELLDDLAQARWEGARYFSDTWWRSPRVYFAFVERSEPIQRVRARGRPGGDVQFTAVGVQPFFALSRQITPLDHEDVSSEQRQNRAGELRRFLGNVPIVSLEFGQFGRLPPGLQIQEGEWWIVGYQPGAQAQATVEIRFPGIDADVQDGGGMTLLTPITARWRRPLRDIFSLVHVPDANFEERPEGVPVASPAPDSPSAAIVDWAPSRGMREA